MTSTAFIIKQNDTLPLLRRKLQDAAGSPVADLTGLLITFRMTKVGATTPKVESPAVIVDGPTAEVQYSWQPGDTDEAGVYDAEWEVNFGAGNVQTVPNDGHMSISIIRELG